MRSKVLILFIIICQSVLSLFAQDKHDRFHGFGSGSSYQLKVYIGPLLAISNVEGYSAIDAGATGGVVIDNNFFLGLYVQKLQSKVPRTNLATLGYATFTDGEINMIHTGGVLGYIHKTNKVLNWGLSGSAGVGKLELLAKGPTNKYSDIIYDDQIIILIPKLFVEMKMTHWFKINLSAGYRLVGRVNGVYINPAGEKIPTFNQSDYIKPEFSIAMLIGKFGFHSYLLK